MSINVPVNISPELDAQKADIVNQLQVLIGQHSTQLTTEHDASQQQLVNVLSQIAQKSSQGEALTQQVINVLAAMVAAGGKFATTEQAINALVTTKATEIIQGLGSKSDAAKADLLSAVTEAKAKHLTLTGAFANYSRIYGSNGSNVVVNIQSPGEISYLFRGAQEGVSLVIDGQPAFSYGHSMRGAVIIGTGGAFDGKVKFKESLVVTATTGTLTGSEPHTGCDIKGAYGKWI